MDATNRQFRIFTDRAYLPEGFAHCSMLRPHWGDPTGHDAYSRYARDGSASQRLVGADEAEVALLPFDGTHLLSKDPAVAGKAREAAGRFAAVAAKAGLRVLVLATDESTAPLGIDGSIVLRNALDRRRRPRGDFAMPGWFDDYVTGYLGGSVVPREKPERPVVGFCGLAATRGPRLRRRAKLLAYRALGAAGVHVPHNDGLEIRRRGMAALEAHPGVRTAFIVRDRFFGGGGDDPEVKARVRREYYDNLVGSDYVLAARGFSNFSFRFFEAMSVGRIPVLIDTDCVLPYDFLHDYRELCVVVPEAEIDRVGDHILRFHARFSPGGYRDLQARIRAFWEEWLSPEGFFRKVPLHLGPEAGSARVAWAGPAASPSTGVRGVGS